MASSQVRQEHFRLLVVGAERSRWIGGQDIGPESARDVLLCLPGLLETQSHFQGLVSALADDCRIFLFDYAGRGTSDPMAEESHYNMSGYLGDLGIVLAHVQGRMRGSAGAASKGLFRERPPPRLHLVGTSMGGLLAMYLAQNRPDGIASIILNDVSSMLPWGGIFGLMTGIGSVTKGARLFGNVNEMAQELGVDPRLLRAVQKPRHLDLPHETTFHGVDFRNLFRQVELPTLILRGGESDVIDDAEEERMRSLNPRVQFSVFPQAGHPVPYDRASLSVIRDFIKSIS